MAADTTRDISVAARSVLRSVQGIQEGSFSVVPFYPENFAIQCHSPEVRSKLLAAPPVPVSGTALVLRPWTRLAHAESATMKFKLSIELEGVPPHA